MTDVLDGALVLPRLLVIDRRAVVVRPRRPEDEELLVTL